MAKGNSSTCSAGIAMLQKKERVLANGLLSDLELTNMIIKGIAGI